MQIFMKDYYIIIGEYDGFLSVLLYSLKVITNFL